jgi:hypothetical protein
MEQVYDSTTDDDPASPRIDRGADDDFAAFSIHNKMLANVLVNG